MPLFHRTAAPPNPPPATRGSTNIPAHTLQDFHPAESLWAIELAAGQQDFASSQEQLRAQLPQNSPQTRARYAQSIQAWFFPDGRLDVLPVLVHRAYLDRSLTTEFVRLAYLTAEPIVGGAVADMLFPLEPGTVVPHDYLDGYLRRIVGQATRKTAKRLRQNLRKLGFLSPGRGRMVLQVVPASGTAVFLAFAFMFAPEGARSMELKTITDHPFWKHLGLKTEDGLRGVFREANGKGLLGKYVVADRIEQVTTRMSFQECLEKRVRL